MTAELDYIAVCHDCGATVGWCSSEAPHADLSWRREIAKSVADWIRCGLSVERCTTEESRQRLATCAEDCPRRKQRKSKQKGLFA